MNEQKSSGLLSIAGLAEYLGVCPRTIMRMEQRGKLPQSIWIGRRKRWRQADVARWVAAK